MAAGNRGPRPRHAVTWAPLCHGSSARQGAAGPAATRLPALDAGAAESTALPSQKRAGPVQAAEVAAFYSPQLFLSFWFLAMVVQGLAAVRRRHRARSAPGPQVAGSGRLCAPLGWAQDAQALDVAVALVGRRREEKTDEPSSASQARIHTNISVTPSLPLPTPRA